MKKLLLTLISFLFILTSYSQYTDDGYYYETDTIEENTTIVNNYYEYEIISYSDRINRFYYYDYWYYYPPTINWFYMDFWYYDYYFNCSFYTNYFKKKKSKQRKK